MSDSMVGAIHVSLAGDLVEQNVRGVAEAIALLRPVIVVDAIDQSLDAELQAQIVSAHAKVCVREVWPQIEAEQTIPVCKGAARSMLVILNNRMYVDEVQPVLAAILRLGGVVKADPVFVDWNHVDAVVAEMTRIKTAIIDLVA